jgi:hypothetical protein
MTIERITQRKDGKFLVSLHYRHGANLRKVMTADQLQSIRASIEADNQQEAAYRAAQADHPRKS